MIANKRKGLEANDLLQTLKNTSRFHILLNKQKSNEFVEIKYELSLFLFPKSIKRRSHTILHSNHKRKLFWFKFLFNVTTKNVSHLIPRKVCNPLKIRSILLTWPSCLTFSFLYICRFFLTYYTDVHVRSSQHYTYFMRVILS